VGASAYLASSLVPMRGTGGNLASSQPVARLAGPPSKPRHPLPAPAEGGSADAGHAGDATMMHKHISLRCEACRHVAVILPEVLTQTAGRGCHLGGQAAREVQEMREVRPQRS